MPTDAGRRVNATIWSFGEGIVRVIPSESGHDDADRGSVSAGSHTDRDRGDDRLFAEMLRNALCAHDEFDVVGIATDGAEAVDLAKRLRPNLVLMDWQMPHVDGIEATCTLRELDDPPAVMLISGTDAAGRSRSRERRRRGLSAEGQRSRRAHRRDRAARHVDCPVELGLVREPGSEHRQERDRNPRFSFEQFLKVVARDRIATELRLGPDPRGALSLRGEQCELAEAVAGPELTFPAAAQLDHRATFIDHEHARPGLLMLGQHGSRRGVDLRPETRNEPERIVVERREEIDATQPLHALCEG
jgi:CheY-like chemotaxis protein